VIGGPASESLCDLDRMAAPLIGEPRPSGASERAGEPTQPLLIGAILECDARRSCRKIAFRAGPEKNRRLVHRLVRALLIM
jgi:hypothetical protein